MEFIEVEEEEFNGLYPEYRGDAQTATGVTTNIQKPGFGS